MKAGAIDFLTKPVRDQTLIDAVVDGIRKDVAQRAEALALKGNVARLETLTPRERQVLHEVARGRVNKQIAFDFGISEVTVKLHRSNVMRKMGPLRSANSFAFGNLCRHRCGRYARLRA
jgi:FixJ family two-component response regulator